VNWYHQFSSMNLQTKWDMTGFMKGLKIEYPLGRC
jgi:hypothetical protein